jgi:BASS family bile acid:Na+ symporter
MEEPYGIGLLLLGMAPCAPFVPMMAEKARGDLAYTGAILVLTAVGTVVFMPFAVPLMAPSVTADAWAIGKPLVLYILAPLALGIAIKDRVPALAQAVYPAVKRITTLATVLMLAGMAIVYGRAVAGAIGSFAIGTQIIYCGALMAAAYRIGPGLAENQRSVLGLGMGTRNIGAAIAPLVAAAGTDPRALVMCVIAMPVTVGLAAIAARLFARRAAAIGSGSNAG